MNAAFKSLASQMLWAAGRSHATRRSVGRLGIRIDRAWYAAERRGEVFVAGRRFAMGCLSNELTCRSYWIPDYYEPLSMVALASLCERAPAFIDVGSNVGLFALFVSSGEVSPQVFAFEPNPEVRAILEGNVQLNGGRATVSPLALSDRRGQATLYLPQSETSGALDPDFNPDIEGRLEVETSTLDAEFPAAGGSLRPEMGRPIVKMDVLGHESAVLRGGREFTRAFRPIYLLEAVREFERDEVEFLRGMGYTFHLLLPGGSREIAQPKGVEERGCYFGNFIATTEPGDVDAVDSALATARIDHLDASSYRGFDGHR